MLALRRSEHLTRLQWDAFPAHPHDIDVVKAIECWKYRNFSHAIQDQNFRVISLLNESPENPLKHNLEQRLEQWLHFKAPYHPLQPPQDVGELQGGIRLVLCEQPDMTHGLLMSRHAFESIESHFGLHAATLPSFFVRGGAYSSFIEKDSITNSTRRISIVVKACQKYEIANYLLSLTYDVATGWTHALICGNGAVRTRHVDTWYGSQLQQLIDAITASPAFWNNPLFLPCILLQNYTQRLETRTGVTEEEMTQLENTLGVTFAGRAGVNTRRERWPQDINPKVTTIELHTLLPRIGFLSNCCKWLGEYNQFLLDLELRVRGDETLQNFDVGFLEIRETLKFYNSVISSLQTFFATVRDRASLLVNVLFNVISQQDSILNRWDSRLNHLIAKSSKQDSISMTTFTFITALFLPGTFIATLFSMSMFDWLPDNEGSSTPESGDSPPTYVSDKIWLFWAIAIPLTLTTMTGWYLWFRFANASWVNELYSAYTASSTETNISKIPEFPYSLPTDKRQKPKEHTIRPMFSHSAHHQKDRDGVGNTYEPPVRATRTIL